MTNLLQTALSTFNRVFIMWLDLQVETTHYVSSLLVKHLLLLCQVWVPLETKVELDFLCPIWNTVIKQLDNKKPGLGSSASQQI